MGPQASAAVFSSPPLHAPLWLVPLSQAAHCTISKAERRAWHLRPAAVFPSPPWHAPPLARTTVTGCPLYHIQGKAQGLAPQACCCVPLSPIACTTFGSYHCHRLLTVPYPWQNAGRGTSGLLLCAISPLARTTLSSVMTHATELMSCKDVGGGGDSAQKALSMRGQQLPAGGVRKVYRALVQGILQATEGKVSVDTGAWKGEQ
eukprot:1136927-Pelagomonas_calceolata.AAC.11